MHRHVMILLVALVAGGVCLAQNPSDQSPAAGSQGVTAASGHQTMAIELSKSLDAKKLKQGDPVRAKITSVFRLSDGKAVPIGSSVQGHVTQVATHSKGEVQSSLGLAFDNIVLKDGTQVPLSATIQAVSAPPEWPISNPANGNRGMGQPPVMGPGTPTSPSGAPYPGGAGNPSGGYPAPQSPYPQHPSGQPDTTNSPTLGPQSTGVFGMRYVTLQPNSVLTSTDKDLKLDAGTSMILRVQDQ